ncbi:TonB-dependent receptor domain-containing protein [Sphingomicrobium flavum]|uniref:TonB-dependent receptor domain-containing protein n=1 Tax=Sphingomicrobium flavum TaxID=1229164 RepID=UPI0021ADD6DA|nr:TonB-dependent receptor [Sphingomicrobium flavum]
MAIGLAATPAYAQEVRADGVTTNEPGDAEDLADQDPSATGDVAADDAIVITGSRVKKNPDTFTSISPLQVLETEISQDVGEFDSAEILQRSEAAAGTQIDATFQGFVLNNGPGSQTLDLRGLGADRTLLLINGRRLAPAGVEGAPTSPSINLIPSSLVQRYDLLLDGASSVYGSDAVAGVGNVILRKDIEGFEVFASGNLNEQSNGGNDYSISGAWGTRGSNYQLGIGAEFAHRDEILLRDRDFFSGCNTHYEVDRDGNIYRDDVASNAFALQATNGAVSDVIQPCKFDRIVGRVQISGTFAGSLYLDNQDYYGLGFAGNYFIPGLSETTDAFGLPVDADNDGVADVNLAERTGNGQDLSVNFLSPQDLYNVMAYGEYTFDGDLELTPFFEANYSRAEVKVENGGTPQFFPWVPRSNVFNPCNFVTNPNGVDCAAAENTYLGAPFNPNVGRVLSVRPIPAVRGDRNNVETLQEQYRAVLGLRSNLPFIGDSWTFEVAGVYSRSEGESIRRGIREDKLAVALGIDPTADFNGDGIVDNDGDGIADDYISQTVSPMLAGGPCDTSSFANPQLAPADLLNGCVPVNLFAQSLYLPGPIGDFATQAERDYLFGERTFDTVYEQTLFSAYATGELFELPGGPLSLVVGGEYRKDKLDSQPDFVASNGLFWGFFADQGAQGDKYLLEGFAELDIPLIDNDALGRIDLNASGRITKDEFYGTNETYSLKGGWAPIPQLLLKASYGTSFRAPNLRENFLAGQSGFGGIFDPCAVPDAAYDGLGGGYNAADDDREAFVIANCQREGRDPFTVGLAAGALSPNQVSSTEITSGGSLDLDPEESTSLTLGASVADRFGDFDVALNVNYYDINVTGAIIEPSGQSIVNDCFLRDDGTRSALCDFIEYRTDPASDRLVSAIFAGFINVNEESVRGLDFNANFGYDVSLGDDYLDLGLNLRANHLLERSTTFLTDDGERDTNDVAGEFGFPSWTGRATLTAGYKDFVFTWQTRWIGETEQDAAGIDEFSDAFGYNEAGEFTGFFSDTCLGAGSRDDDGNLDGIVQGDGRYCRDVGYAEDYFVHTVSLRWNMNEDVTLRAGITNLFDKQPPLIDTDEVFGRSNVAIGNGYDLNGREYFASLSVKF